MEGIKRLIIARHGNTFEKGETPRRIGAKTDLPLVEEEKARSIGKYLLSNNLIPDKIYAAPLKRTLQTAKLAIEEMKLAKNAIPVNDFIEIDYGPDENKTEEQVMERLGRYYLMRDKILSDTTPFEEIIKRGEQAIDLWNSNATVPEGWKVDTDKIIAAWKKFANQINDKETVMLVSSNGIIRFAPYILDMDYKEFCNTHDIKVATGGICIFDYQDNKWVCKEWNVKPYKIC